MSEDLNFLGGATGDLATEFIERTRFLNYFRSKEYPLLDTLYDKKLYGFVNSKAEIISPVKNIKRFGEDSGTVSGLNYVVDMFNRLRSAIRLVESIKVPELIQEFKPVKNFEDFEENYKAYEVNLANKLASMLIPIFQNRPLTMDEFLDTIERTVYQVPGMSNFPLTKSGYAISSNSSAYHTGLYLDLLPDQDGSLDASKPAIIEDPNFECYVGICYQYGFYVDANSPWRLVMNLENEFVKANILNGRPLSEFEKFYSDVYTIKTGYDDYWALKNFVEKLYVEIHRLLGLPIQSVPSLRDQSRWLDFLLSNRFFELGLITSVEQKSEILYSKTLQKVLDTYRIYGLSSNVGAIGLVNSFCASKLKEMIEQNENIANTRHSQQLQGFIL